MKRFKNILYVAQSSVPQSDAIVRAVSFAKSNQAGLTVVEVVPEWILSAGGLPGAPSVDDLRDRLVTNRSEELESLVESAGGGSDVEIQILFGTPFLEVIRAVLRDGYDLVMKAAENPNWSERLFGSDDMHLLRKCPCPVWMMRADEKTNYSNIMAAVDFDPPDGGHVAESDAKNRSLNEQIVSLGASISLSDFAQLHIVHAWDAPETGFASMWTDDPEVAEVKMLEAERARHHAGMEALTHQLRQQVGEESYQYLSPRVQLPKGAARTVVPEQARAIGADLVIMGTVARTGIRGLIIGNTAEAILDQLPCSVLAVKPDGFVSPVGE
ncbi:nucleotide-binding universal stress UspA family protein [Tamilnaduibacter salinus]|uniref:Nucleotide-binding universal stress UspA family protein n=1 Tax=Tamilnaduibacter salinus TaxID=1484056 RepID=A0A2A2I0D7_9GAMM|nr:universal stress protein [Tamilnaduibacter salinus]PAV24570.1 universal stress protein [Tamilnaduibacter salinus]PVY78431.1 nucleotide-binding universal stress UspA family protein [Tamilnaduibacter salinus]